MLENAKLNQDPTANNEAANQAADETKMFADQAKGLLEELVSTIEDIARFVEVVDRESTEAISTKDATEKIRDDSVS